MNIDNFNNVGKMALLGDVWYQVMDCRTANGKTEYKLYTRENWIPHEWVKQFKERKQNKIEDLIKGEVIL